MKEKAFKELLDERLKDLNIELTVLVKHFSRILKKNEFTGARLGEFGLLVPKPARASGQPDNLAPNNRLNAFYSYCAFEYYMKKDSNFYRNELDRILSFVNEKLGSSYLYITRAADGYQIGSQSTMDNTEINIRHTVALSMILAMENADFDRLEKIKKLLLSDFVQNENGGWYIWESDKELKNGTDPITSTYALIMLNYFTKYSIRIDEKNELEERISKTAKYLMEKFDHNINLWLIPRLNYYETIQMSVWYFSILYPHLINNKTYNLAEILNSFCDSISIDKIENIENHPIRDDVIFRVVFLCIQFRSYLSKKNVERLLEVLIDKLNDYENIDNTTTF